MKHPEIILLPILMFLDYFLTILGAIQKDKKYSEHFKTQHYELNPIWQKQITQKKWFNLRHIILTIVFLGFLIYLVEFSNISDSFALGLLGFLFVLFGVVIGRHLSNIMIFRYLARRPDEISGQVTMAHSLLLSMSVYQYLMVAFPLAFIAVFSPTPFVLGGFLGAASIFLIHLKWILQHRKQMRASDKPAERS